MLCSVGLHKEEELLAFKKRMEAAQMRTMDMTNNDLAKDHLRHLVSCSDQLLFLIVEKTVYFPCFCCIARLNPGLYSSMVQMGGQTKIEHELLYRFVFPERPGALMQFLEVFSPQWNITLFHYRSQVIYRLKCFY